MKFVISEKEKRSARELPILAERYLMFYMLDIFMPFIFYAIGTSINRISAFEFALMVNLSVSQIPNPSLEFSF